MGHSSSEHLMASCTCSNVELLLTGAPIWRIACYCDDCQAGARQLANLPRAPSIMDSDGGTKYLLYRKDRVKCWRGADRLVAYRLRAESPMRRVIAGCCNTPMFADYEKGHWFSIYQANVNNDASSLEMRIQTRFAPDSFSPVSDSVPGYRFFPLRFIIKLVLARIGMLFYQKPDF